MLNYKKIIDISQPVTERSAVFPGDTEFKKKLVLSYRESKVVNLTQFTMSPHVGTHIDAPAHIKGDMDVKADLIGSQQLNSFIGPVTVIDLAPRTEGVSWNSVKEKLLAQKQFPSRILFRTMTEIRYEIFEDDYSFFEEDLVDELHKRHVCLLGIDAPSADHIRSKTLAAHHKLEQANMVWLENLDLTNVAEGDYYLVALPLKFMELEASPSRAVLLEF